MFVDDEDEDELVDIVADEPGEEAEPVMDAEVKADGPALLPEYDARLLMRSLPPEVASTNDALYRCWEDLRRCLSSLGDPVAVDESRGLL